MCPSARKPPRRRAQQARSERTIAVVLEAAAQVLQREGYARATTNRIAERAGVSVGTVYQYFADKEQIFDTLIAREIAGLRRVLQRVVPDPGESLADALRRVFRLLVQARPDAPVLYRSLEQVPGSLFRRRVAEARGSVIDWVRELLASHRSELRVQDLDVAAFLVVASAEGVAVSASPELYRSSLAEELTLLFTRYLTASRT